MRSPARDRPYHLQPNLTSLIDVVFLLLVFFLLATQLTREQRVEMDLPALDDRESVPNPKSDTRMIVNVIPFARRGGVGGAYQIEKQVFAGDPAGIEALAEMLRRAKAADPGVRVLLRAPRDEHYERVHPAMQAVTLAGVSAVDLVTVPPEGELERIIERENGGNPR